jgi:hypothetical protein
MPVRADKSIMIQDRDLLNVDTGRQHQTEQGIALMLARKLYETEHYLQGDFINTGTGIGVSQDFHELVEGYARCAPSP